MTFYPALIGVTPRPVGLVGNLGIGEASYRHLQGKGGNFLDRYVVCPWTRHRSELPDPRIPEVVSGSKSQVIKSRNP